MTFLLNPYQFAVAAAPAPVATGLTVWLKADAITGKVDGDRVSPWLDSSGLNNHAENAAMAASPFHPIYKVNQQNGLPILQFNNAPRLNIPGLNGLTAATMFVVLKATGSPFGGMSDMGTASGEAYYPWSNAQIYDTFATTARKDVIVPGVALTQWNVVTIVSAASDYRYYINQVNKRTTATNTVGWKATPRFGMNGSYALSADVAEILIYSGALSAGDRDTVEDYLKAKWATV